MKNFIIIASIAILLSGCAAAKAIDNRVDALEDGGVEVILELVESANQALDRGYVINTRRRLKLDEIGRALGRGK